MNEGNAKKNKNTVFSVPAWNSKVGANSWATLLESYPASNVACVSIRDEYRTVPCAADISRFPKTGLSNPSSNAMSGRAMR